MRFRLRKDESGIFMSESGESMMFIYSGTVSSSIHAICERIRTVVEQVNISVPMTDDTAADLRLILSELMINGCEHGNRNQRTKMVSLELEARDGEIVIRVGDEGGGFTVNPHSESADPCRCSGRGLRIVKALCKEFSVDSKGVRCVFSTKKQQQL